MARRITIEFLGQDRSVGKTVDAVESKTSKLGSRLAGIGKAAAVGFAAVGTGAIVAGKYLFNHGAQLEQMDQKAKTVFGSQIGEVQKWGKANAAAMGLTRREAVGLAANFGDLLVPMGFTRKQAAAMSTDVIGLSGALSQWSGGQKSAAEVSEILSAAMLGETDGLKSLGIAISAADIEARLATKGQQELTGAARQQAEAQAIQALIMEKSTDAQAAFAKGGSPLLTAQAKIKAAFGEVRDTLAVKLLPAFASVGSWIVDKGLPAISRFGAWFSENLMPILSKVGGFIKGQLSAALSGLIGWLKKSGGGVDTLKKAWTDMQPALKLIGAALKGIGWVIGKLVWPIVKKVAEVALPAMAKALGAVGKVGIWLWNNALQPAFRLIVKGIGWLLEKWGGMLRAMSKVPGFGWADEAGRKMQAAGREAQDLANSIQRIPNNKTVSVTTHFNATYSEAYKNGIKLSQLQGRARGGPTRAGETYIVGEEGPELWTSDTSGRILDAPTTRRMMESSARPVSGGGSGGDQVVGHAVVDLRLDGRTVQRVLLKLKRTTGMDLGLA